MGHTKSTERQSCLLMHNFKHMVIHFFTAYHVTMRNTHYVLCIVTLFADALRTVHNYIVRYLQTHYAPVFCVDDLLQLKFIKMYKKECKHVMKKLKVIAVRGQPEDK